MVTATMIVALSGIMAPEPLAARSRHRSHVAPQVEATRPPAATASAVPLPQPRPAEAPPRASTETAKGKDAPSKGDGKDNGKEEAGPPPPSACRLALTDELAIAPSIPAIHGPGACGGDDLVRLEAVVLPDKTRVALTPPGIMRCTMATAVVNWMRNDVAPEVAKLGSEIKALDNFDSYECRGRNGVPGAQLSEHGKANAIDVHGFKLADGRMIELTDRTQPREFREAVLHSACTRFPTVLGPDSDWHHENHIHLDLIERRSNYRICQWDVLDPMPKVAPLLPEVRPDDAPPREVAEAAGPRADKSKDQADAKAGDAKGSAIKNGDAKTADDRKPDDKAAGKAAVAAGKDRSEPAKPASPAPQPKTASADSADKKSESKPAADARPGSKAAADTAAKQKAADQAEKPAAPAGKASTERTASDKSASDKTASDKSSSPEKASRKKIAADKPRRHRHRARVWNPFALFF